MESSNPLQQLLVRGIGTTNVVPMPRTSSCCSGLLLSIGWGRLNCLRFSAFERI